MINDSWLPPPVHTSHYTISRSRSPDPRAASPLLFGSRTDQRRRGSLFAPREHPNCRFELLQRTETPAQHPKTCTQLAGMLPPIADDPARAPAELGPESPPSSGSVLLSSPHPHACTEPSD